MRPSIAAQPAVRADCDYHFLARSAQDYGSGQERSIEHRRKGYDHGEWRGGLAADKTAVGVDDKAVLQGVGLQLKNVRQSSSAI